ncbi:MAG: hypothetical protein ACK5QH_05930 [Rubrivivax sp.]
MKPHHASGRVAAPLLAAVVLAAMLVWWLAGGDPAPVQAAASAGAAPSAFLVQGAAAAGPAPAASAGLPLGAGLTPAQKAALKASWQERLARAQTALAAFEQHARYPVESRPISEHPDQVRPFQPIAEDRPLRLPGGSVGAAGRLRTTQERIFLAGRESSRVTVSLVDAEGRVLPLRTTRALLAEVTEPGRTASTTPLPVVVADNGQNGDQQAGDGVLSATIAPAAQGFGQFAGTVRLELWLEHAGQPGYLYFDVVYSPETAATWLPGVREAVVNGQLQFTLRAQVLVPGRYVVSGRIDDASGQPVALAQFNAEIGAGAQDLVLPVAGRLLHDLKPSFPLRLRDVEAFLLKPDAFPDRVMLPRLAGVVHQSAVYALDRFTTETPPSDQRDRYLGELGRDVDEAKRALVQLGP